MKCPPGTICDVDGMTNPCSHSDLPTPYTPVVKYQVGLVDEQNSASSSTVGGVP